jgi:hypothetical protein
MSPLSLGSSDDQDKARGGTQRRAHSCLSSTPPHPTLEASRRWALLLGGGIPTTHKAHKSWQTTPTRRQGDCPTGVLQEGTR